MDHPRAATDDPSWVAMLRDGGELAFAKAFDDIYAAYRTRIYGYLVRLSRSRDVAEDLTQEVFLRLAKHARRLRPDTNLRPWLFTVAHHAMVSHARSTKLTSSLAAELSRDDVRHADSPFETVVGHRDQQRLEQAIAALAPLYREVVLLVSVGGLAPMEAAAVLNVPPATVRQRLARARASIAEALDNSASPASRSTS